MATNALNHYLLLSCERGIGSSNIESSNITGCDIATGLERVFY